MCQPLVLLCRFSYAPHAHHVDQKPDEPSADFLSMLLANLSKWDGFEKICKRRQAPPQGLGSDELVLNQLVDVFVKGSEKTYNKNANYEYLAYLFADLSKHAAVRKHLVSRQDYDGVITLSKLKVFTEHKSEVRRAGVASTIKNVAFDTSSHASFLAASQGSDGESIGILPYVLLPLIGGETYDEDEMLDMLPDLQLLPPDKQRDPDPAVVQTHIETLTLLAGTRKGREVMREVQVYPVIRETHLHVNHDGVREACERLVQLLKGDESEEKESGDGSDDRKVDDDEDDSDDDKIVEV